LMHEAAADGHASHACPRLACSTLRHSQHRPAYPSIATSWTCSRFGYDNIVVSGATRNGHRSWQAAFGDQRSPNFVPDTTLGRVRACWEADRPAPSATLRANCVTHNKPSLDDPGAR
jgi:hypothetical protein